MKGLRRQLPEPEPEERPDPYCAKCSHIKGAERLQKALCGRCEVKLQKLMNQDIFVCK